MSDAHRFLADPFDDRGLLAEGSELMFRARRGQDFALYLQAIRTAHPWLFFALAVLWCVPSSTGPLEACFNYAGLYCGKRRWMLSHQALSSQVLAHQWPFEFRKELFWELSVFQNPSDWRQHMAATGLLVDRSSYGGLDSDVIDAGLAGVIPVAATAVEVEETLPLMFVDTAGGLNHDKEAEPDGLPPEEDAPSADDPPWLPADDHLDGQAFEAAALEDFDEETSDVDPRVIPRTGQGMPAAMEDRVPWQADTEDIGLVGAVPTADSVESTGSKV
jgi:hypothetical protein